MFRRYLFLLLLVFGVHDVGAINLIAPPQVKPTPDGDAVLTWKLDSPAGGKVRYGLAENQLDQSASDGVGTEHSVTLRGLKKGTRYFFSVGTARTPLTAGSFIAGEAGDVLPAAKPPVSGKVAAPVAPPVVKPVPAPVVRDAPATRLTWANMGSLQDHFDRHGGDFGAKSPDDYAAQAWRFRERALAERLPMKLDTDGTVRVFDPKTRAFASFNRDGTTKTYFRPNSASYWQRQPGKPVQTPPWVSQ